MRIEASRLNGQGCPVLPSMRRETNGFMIMKRYREVRMIDEVRGF
jgi:hypothetical protein